MVLECTLLYTSTGIIIPLKLAVSYLSFTIIYPQLDSHKPKYIMNRENMSRVLSYDYNAVLSSNVTLCIIHGSVIPFAPVLSN